MKLPQNHRFLLCRQPIPCASLFYGKPKPVWDGHIDYQNEFYGKNVPFEQIQLKSTSSETLVDETRKIARNYISSHAFHLYETTLDRFTWSGNFHPETDQTQSGRNIRYSKKRQRVDRKKIEGSQTQTQVLEPQSNCFNAVYTKLYFTKLGMGR